MDLEVRTLRPEELDPAFALDRQAFNTPPARRDAFVKRKDPARFHGVFAGGRLAAMTYVYPFGQFFGGRAVPMGGLSSVATAPEHRGRGLASRTIEAALAAMHERGEAISALYPASVQLYRKLGWEVAGLFAYRRTPTAALLGMGADRKKTIRRANRDDLPGMRDCYRRVASGVNGFLDLPDALWDWRIDWSEDLYVYVSLDSDERVDGYTYYRHKDRSDGFGYWIDLRQLVAASPAATRALWRMVGTSATQAEQVRLVGPLERSLLLLLPEQTFEAAGEIRWMLRVVDAPLAIRERGFPAGLRARVDLELRDAHCAWNRGRFRLEVEGGRGRLRPGGDGTVRLGIGAFAALYSGWATTHVLAGSGLVEGGGPEQRALLDAAFGGPTPHLIDEF